MLEGPYKTRLIKNIKKRLPGCIVLKQDPELRTGIPDLLILFGDRWAALEVKRSARESAEPNQEYYVDLFNDWSFAAFIYPENEEEVLDALQFAFTTRKSARVSKR